MRTLHTTTLAETWLVGGSVYGKPNITFSYDLHEIPHQ